MKSNFHPAFTAKKQAIDACITHFNEKGKAISEGRNTIKIFDVEGMQVSIKAFKIPNAINTIIYRFIRKSKAERSFLHASKLQELGIGTPAPIAYYEDPALLLFKESYYVCEHLQADLTYRDLIRDENYPDRTRILEEFTAFTFQLHENGILFKDHSPGNTLIKKTEKGYRFYLVDLNRMQFKELSFEERIKNFSRLTPHKEMVAIMSKAYAALTPWTYEEIFSLMWKETDAFQQRYFRKKRWKKKLLFRKS